MGVLWLADARLDGDREDSHHVVLENDAVRVGRGHDGVHRVRPFPGHRRKRALTWLPRRRRPHLVTRIRASRTTSPLILDWPTARSVNVIGTSTTVKPAS